MYLSVSHFCMFADDCSLQRWSGLATLLGKHCYMFYPHMLSVRFLKPMCMFVVVDLREKIYITEIMFSLQVYPQSPYSPDGEQSGCYPLQRPETLVEQFTWLPHLWLPYSHFWWLFECTLAGTFSSQSLKIKLRLFPNLFLTLQMDFSNAVRKEHLQFIKVILSCLKNSNSSTKEL